MNYLTKQRMTKLQIITSNIPDGNINKKYNLQLEYSGTQPVIWSVTGLPNDLIDHCIASEKRKDNSGYNLEHRS